MSSASDLASPHSYVSASDQARDCRSSETCSLLRSQTGFGGEEDGGANVPRKRRKRQGEDREEREKQGRGMRRRRTEGEFGLETVGPIAKPAGPEALLRGTDNQSIFTALRTLESKGSVRQDYPLGTPLWAYISAAYFTDASTLRSDLLRLQDTDHLGTSGYSCNAESLETDYEGLEEYWNSELQECRYRSESLLEELRTRVGEACRADSTLRPGNSIKQQRRKEEETGWMSLIHSKYFSLLISSVHSPQPRPVHPPTADPDSDIYCDICLDGVSTEEDPIVLCSKCDLAVHMTCFGLLDLPEGDWFCEKCVNARNTLVLCSICGKGDGALKRGSTRPIGVSGWSHVYCADHLPGSSYSSPSTKSDVDLSKVDVRRCALRCQICEEKAGACLQCTYRNCLSAFHPSCWKAEFLTPNDPDESTFTCYKHTSIALPERQEKLDRQHFQALQVLYRTVASAPMPVCRQVGLKCGDAEMKAFAKIAKKALSGYNYREKVVGFRVILNPISRTTEIRAPTHWSSLSPDLFRRDQLRLSPHTPEVSAQLYECAYPQLRKRGKRRRVELKRATAELLELEYSRTVEIRKRTRQKATMVRFPLQWAAGNCG